MMHPGEKELALYSSHDLGWVNNIRVRWHVNSCGQCAEDVSAFENVGSAVRSGVDELPAGLRWERLAAEMTANIHLGLEAGECVGPAPVNKPDRMGWRAALVMASMTIILLAAWWLNPPRGREVAMHRSAAEIRTAPEGIEVKENGSALTLLHTRGQQTPIIVSTPGSLRARFVDADTGQVTINNVYSD
jgi:hypothetical protein